MNAPENLEHPERPENPETPGSPLSPDGPDPAEERTSSPRSEGTSLYVRRRRTPALPFWVAIAIAVPLVAALLVAPFLDFADLGSVLGFAMTTALFVGLPAAAIICLVDALRHRGSRTSDRDRRR